MIVKRVKYVFTAYNMNLCGDSRSYHSALPGCLPKCPTLAQGGMLDVIKIICSGGTVLSKFEHNAQYNTRSWENH